MVTGSAYAVSQRKLDTSAMCIQSHGLSRFSSNTVNPSWTYEYHPGASCQEGGSHLNTL